VTTFEHEAVKGFLARAWSCAAGMIIGEWAPHVVSLTFVVFSIAYALYDTFGPGRALWDLQRK